MTATCKVCTASASPFGEATLLGRHKVRYFRCGTCGFVQTEEPYWLAEAYQEALSGLDVGAVGRNLRLATQTQAVLRRFFNPSGRFLDYGGGAGLFVRLMRDAGFDFWWMDKYARNVFARGFEAPQGPFELLTAFEVFEHLVQPATELEQMLAHSRNVLFTTVLLPEAPPPPGQWWYYGLEHGQHVALYTPAALQALAARFGLRSCSSGELHLFTAQNINPAQLRRTMKWATWINRRSPRRSLTEADYQRLSQAQRDGNRG